MALVACQAVWAVAASGCGGSAGAEYGCPELPACGGDPTGSWDIVNGPNLGSFCQYRPPLNYSVPTLTPPMMVTQTPTVQVAPKSPGDDCADLVYEPEVTAQGSHVKTVALPHATGEVRALPLVMKPTHEYSVAVQTVSKTTYFFSRACMNAYGANPSCADLEVGFASFETAMPNFLVGTHPFNCTPTTDNGCSCVYEYESTAAYDGTWQVEGNILYFFSDGEDLIQPTLETTFCVHPGRSFSVSGRDGQSLFNIKGLRSFTLVPSSM